MPQRELERLQRVNRFLKLEISKEKELQEIVDLAASICSTPTALLTFIDKDTQYIRFKRYFDYDRTTREDAFCNHVIEQDDVMVVPDAMLDHRFVNNPLVTGSPNIRFYAGSPLATQDGHRLGSLCVIDQQPRDLSDIQQQMLAALSKQAMQLLEFEQSVQILKEQFIEAKRAEIELRSFFESTIDNHLLLGKNFEVLAFNKMWENYVKSTDGVVIERGKSMMNFLHPENAETFLQDYLKALKGTAVFVQREMKIGDGYGWRIIKFEPAFNNNGEIIGVSVNSTDITNKIKQDQMLAEQNESLKEIAFMQSHEFRRPVASIMGLMDILKMDEGLHEIEAFRLLEKAVAELDEKIHLVVNHAGNNQKDE
ncbi:GAF domain-containing protein [Mucilaginibacter sp. RS28]|uniref:histidine kinase n=1 Tax=Mucilaginibacter straminoryzae TaxID=2932774 RepID=A0A9X1X6W6_9SPHI|nr:GAF domain-containing protein [Mucilaginibacter straminoryzae]MCJ8210793.1 GAF domain-containing protein [Mucilaginibacter straminoryzae]